MSAIRRRFVLDPTRASGSPLVMVSHQEVDAILEDNTACMNAPRPGSRLHHSGLEVWYRVASVPLLLIEKWFTEKGINFFSRHHWPEVRKLLNDSEWGKLRTAPGRL